MEKPYRWFQLLQLQNSNQHGKEGWEKETDKAEYKDNDVFAVNHYQLVS
jgi:hypothetical protein